MGLKVRILVLGQKNEYIMGTVLEVTNLSLSILLQLIFSKVKRKIMLMLRRFRRQ